MSEQPAGIIETIARNRGINLQNALLAELLYIYALTFIEIDIRLQEELIDFPEASLQEIVEAFRTIFNSFNHMHNQLMDRTIANEIKIAKNLLVKARGFADSAAKMVRNIEPDSAEYYENLPVYQQHLNNCAIQVSEINNQISGWLQPE